MIASLKERYEVLLADGLPVEWLDTKADIVRHAPHLADADLEVRRLLVPLFLSKISALLI